MTLLLECGVMHKQLVSANDAQNWPAAERVARQEILDEKPDARSDSQYKIWLPEAKKEATYVLGEIRDMGKSDTAPAKK